MVWQGVSSLHARRVRGTHHLGCTGCKVIKTRLCLEKGLEHDHGAYIHAGVVYEDDDV